MASYVTEVKERPGDPLGGASGEKFYFNVEFLGKRNNPDFPYQIANEVVASQIGIALGLEIPSFFTHRHADETVFLTQMRERHPVTTRELQDFAESHTDEVHGAIVFDLFVANNDRAFGPERRNLFLDARRRLVLYDHGNACFYRPRPKAGIQAGVRRLEAVTKNLAAIFDMDHRENYYRQLLTDWPLVEKWCERVKAVPEFQIVAAVARIPSELERPNEAERAKLEEFLLARRLDLFDQILKHRSCFSGLPKRKGKRS